LFDEEGNQFGTQDKALALLLVLIRFVLVVGHRIAAREGIDDLPVTIYIVVQRIGVSVLLLAVVAQDHVGHREVVVAVELLVQELDHPPVCHGLVEPQRDQLGRLVVHDLVRWQIEIRLIEAAVQLHRTDDVRDEDLLSLRELVEAVWKILEVAH
jgi:hypothetical protein